MYVYIYVDISPIDSQQQITILIVDPQDLVKGFVKSGFVTRIGLF